MKLRDIPLWLVRDLVCWLGILFSFPAVAKAFQRIATATREQGRGMRRSELSLLARLLAEAEAWLNYAVLRRAFKLAGLKVSRVKFAQPTPATTLRALLSRGRKLQRLHLAMDAAARQTAKRLIRLLAAPVLPAAATAERIPKTAHPLSAPRRHANHVLCAQSARAAATTTALIATNTRSPGQRVRAPPWRPTAYCLLPTAPEAPLPRSRPFADSGGFPPSNAGRRPK